MTAAGPQPSGQLDTGPLQDWVQPGASLLDMACGNGEILAWLIGNSAVRGCGVEIDAHCIQRCLDAGVDVLQQDLNKKLDMFTDDSFDIVLAKEALHYTVSPDRVLEEMLRIGRRVVVAFDNAGWWRRRAYFVAKGRYRDDSAPSSSPWYQQQRSRPFSIADFDDLCRTVGCEVLDRRYYPASGIRSNLLVSRAWYLLRTSS